AVFAVGPARERGMAAEGLDRAMILPAPIHVAGAARVAPHISELRAEHRLPGLLPRRFEIPRGGRKRTITHTDHELLPAPPRQIFVPGVEIRLAVSAVTTDGVVLDQSRRVE